MYMRSHMCTCTCQCVVSMFNCGCCTKVDGNFSAGFKEYSSAPIGSTKSRAQRTGGSKSRGQRTGGSENLNRLDGHTFKQNVQFLLNAKEKINLRRALVEFNKTG